MINQNYFTNKQAIHDIVFEEFQKKGTEVKDIAVMLNEKGYLTKRGKPFSGSLVSKLASDIGCTPRRINQKVRGYRKLEENQTLDTQEVLNVEVVEEQEDIELVETSVITKNYELRTVQFNNVTMIAIKTEDGKIFTSIKKICQDIGIDERGQQQRILRDEILKKGACIIHVPSNENGNKQPTLCLDIEYLPFWLIGIQSNRCKDEVKSYLIEFKMKAQKILSDAFIRKEEVKQDKPLSLSEMLLAQAQLNVDLERKVLLVDSKVNQIEKKIDDRLDEITKNANRELLNFPKPSIEYEQMRLYNDPNDEEQTQTEVDRLVKTFANIRVLNPQVVYTALYNLYQSINHINIYLRANNEKLSKIQWLRKHGKIKEFYSFVYKHLIENDGAYIYIPKG